VLLVATVPAHAGVLRLPWDPVDADGHGSPDRQVLKSRTFVFLAAAGTLASLSTYASLVHLVPLLLDQGLGVRLAAWALGLSGAAQVLGRLLYPTLDRRLAPNTRAATILVVMAASLVALAAVPGPAVLLVVVAVVGGVGRGLFTLVGATIVTDHWGPDRYAALNGVYQAPKGVAAALAPAFGAAVAAVTGGYTAMFWVLAGLAAAGAGLAATAGQPDLSERR
jgi:cyanate permease